MDNHSFTYGKYNFIDQKVVGEFFTQSSYQVVDIISYWRRCSLIANFYTDFCAENIDIIKNNESLHGTISVIFNELIENAAKYSDINGTSIEIYLSSFFRLIKFKIVNYISEGSFYKLKNKIDIFEQTLKKGKTVDEIYFEHLNSKEEGDGTSQLGYLMMMKDYPVQFGFHFLKLEEDKYKIDVEAYINCNLK